MPMIEENRIWLAHAPRVFRTAPSSVGVRAGKEVSGGADHGPRGRVRSPCYTLGPLTRDIASGYDHKCGGLYHRDAGALVKISG